MSHLLANEPASGHVPLPQSLLCSSVDYSWLSELLLIEPDPTVLSSRTLMLTQFRYRVTVAMSHKEVACLRGSKVHLAVVSASLSPDNLRATAEFIRRQWTSARILVVGDAVPVLEDQLYDEAIDTTSSSDELLVALRKLSAFPWGKCGDASSGCRGFSATASTADLLADRQSPPESDPTKTRYFERDSLVPPDDLPASEQSNETELDALIRGSLNGPLASNVRAR